MSVRINSKNIGVIGDIDFFVTVILVKEEGIAAFISAYNIVLFTVMNKCCTVLNSDTAVGTGFYCG